jgi:hypothetical protein
VLADAPIWCDGTARVFDGLTTVALPDFQSAALTDFTIEARITPTSTDNSTRWAFGGTRGSDAIALYVTKSKIGAIVTIGGKTSDFSGPKASGRHAVAVVHSGKSLLFYVDGKLVKKLNTGPAGTIDPSAWALGAKPDGTAPFVGTVEDAAFYLTALPAARIAAHAAG